MSDTALNEVQVLAFDVFGTVVDWCGAIAGEVSRLLPHVDGQDFARRWRAGYQPAMERVRSGELPWTRIDDLHALILEDVLAGFGVHHLNTEEKADLNRAWHRLRPWPEAIEGLHRLRKDYVITPLSNGNISLLTHMAKRAGLPWDCVLSAEIFRRYKPHPATYLGVADLFAVRPDQVMLVAAHHEDLAAARACGLLTAYVERPFEYGADQPPKDVSPKAQNTLHARDFLVLADQLDAVRAAA